MAIKDVLSDIGQGIGGGVGVGALLGGKATRQRFSTHVTQRRKLPLREMMSSFLGINPEGAKEMRTEIKDLEKGGFDAFLKQKAGEAGFEDTAVTPTTEASFKTGDFTIPAGQYKGGSIKVASSGQYYLYDKAGKQIGSGKKVLGIPDESIRDAVITEGIAGVTEPGVEKFSPEKQNQLREEYNKQVASKKDELRKFLHDELPYYADLVPLYQLALKQQAGARGGGTTLMKTAGMKRSLETYGKVTGKLQTKLDSTTMNSLKTQKQQKVVRSEIAGLIGSINALTDGLSIKMPEEMPADQQSAVGAFSSASVNAIRPYIEGAIDLYDNPDKSSNSMPSMTDMKNTIRALAIKTKRDPNDFLAEMKQKIINARKVGKDIKDPVEKARVRAKAFNVIYEDYADTLALQRTIMVANDTIESLKASRQYTERSKELVFGSPEFNELQDRLSDTYKTFLRSARGKILGGFIQVKKEKKKK